MTRIVNGVEQPDDPNEIADKANRAIAGTPEVRVVPPVITNYQFRKALRDMSAATINAFKTYVVGASEEIQDYWQFSPFIRRDHANVEAVRVALNRTQANIDTFFRNAARIT